MKAAVNIFLLCLVAAMSTGCKKGMLKKEPNWNINLTEDNKDPYGAYLAFHSLKYFFPDAKVTQLSKGFRYTNMTDEMKYNYDGHSLLVLAGMSFQLTDNEWKELKQFVRSGNEVVLFCSSLDSKIEQDLGCYKPYGYEASNDLYPTRPDLDNRGILTLVNDNKNYGYKGRSVRGYFTIPSSDDKKTDTTGSSPDTTSSDEAPAHPDTLGYAEKTPNIIRYTLGDGHLTLHAAPLVLSNYFLLQENNINYLAGIWKTLPDNVNKIYWNGYGYRTTDVSSFEILWRYAATRLALILGICLLITYILFEGKRKQRIIPVIPPLRNDSVSFVTTVGRLYYNKGNHTNLAEKMVQQFLEWVRMHYFLNTNLINEAFVQQLTVKSGQPESKVRALVEMVHEIRTRSISIDDAYLYQLYNIIQQFYQNNHT